MQENLFKSEFENGGKKSLIYVIPFDSLWGSQKYRKGKDNGGGDQNIFPPVYPLNKFGEFITLAPINVAAVCLSFGISEDCFFLE